MSQRVNLHGPAVLAALVTLILAQYGELALPLLTVPEHTGIAELVGLESSWVQY